MMSAKVILLLCALANHQDTTTSQTTEGPTCVYNNVTYKPGPIPTDDPCQYCECPPEGGYIEACFTMPCPGCEDNQEPVYRPGECCHGCQQKDCYYDGNTYKVDETIHLDTCQWGVCSISSEIYWNPEFECCIYKNKTYETDTYFTISQCASAYCDRNGHISTFMPGCARPDCPDPVYFEDECCPRCPDNWGQWCYYEGQAFNVYDSVEMETCITGYCNDYGQWYRIPSCCVYDNKTYQTNTDFRINPCTYGYCEQSGEVSIAVADCARPYCPEPVYVEDECCPRCPDYWGPTCYYDGQTYNVGDTVEMETCITSYCTDHSEWDRIPSCCVYDNKTYQINEEVNDLVTCAIGICTEYGVQWSDTFSCCIYEDTKYETDTDFMINPCTYGYCERSGQVSIAMAGCPAPYCPEPVYAEDECCPRCPDDWVPTCYYEGQTYNVNEEVNDLVTCAIGVCTEYGGVEWGNTFSCCIYEEKKYELNSNFIPSPCVFGNCDSDGQVSIAMADCPDCDHPVYVPGECCPQCNDIYWTTPQPQCYYEGQTYNAGDTFQADTCITGYCDGDYAVRFSITCCVYNNQTYEPGPIPTDDPCESCECYPEGGEVMCYLEGCTECSSIEEIITRPGHCCPGCQPKTITCYHNGVAHQVDDTVEIETCVTGYCNNYGEWDRSPSCCVYDNKTLELNSNFELSPCEFMFCTHDGHAGIIVMDCFYCEHPVYVPGQCCPQCNDSYPDNYPDYPVTTSEQTSTVTPCDYNGVTYQVNDEVNDLVTCAIGVCTEYGVLWGDTLSCCIYEEKKYELNSYFKPSPCEYGHCENDGQVSIAMAGCRYCQHQVYVPGECCPKCNDDLYQSDQSPCYYEGQTYNAGETFQADTCILGYCDGDYGIAFSITCCVYNNQTYELNSDFMISPCEYGYCGYDGEVAMAGMDCPNCDNPVYVPGECCPQCNDDIYGTTAQPSCYYEGQTYNAGETFQVDVCTTGYCDGDYGVAISSPACCVYNNQTYELNSDFMISPCEYGYCQNDGQVSIAMASCPYCEQPVYVPGQCCPQCNDDIYQTTTQPQCYYDGKTYNAGETFQVDACNTGYCDGDYGLAITNAVCCVYNNQTYDSGPVPTDDPCLSCECPPEGGNVWCASQSCPQCPEDQELVYKAGQCCPDCQPKVDKPDC